MANAQGLSPDDALSRLTAQDISESLISLVNITTAAGVRGMRLTVDGQEGQPDFRYTKANVRIPKTWRTENPKLGIYTEIGIGDLIVDDPFVGENVAGDTVSFRAERKVFSARAGLGFRYQLTPEIRVTPHIIGAFSRIKSKTEVIGGTFNPADLTPVEAALLTNWTTKSWTVAGVLRADYRYWLNETQRIHVVGDYAYAYTDTFDETLRILDTSGQSNSLQFEIGYTKLTKWTAFGKPIYWSALAQSLSFPGQDKDDLGFNYLFGVGGGVGLYLNQKILGDFGHVNFAGLEFSALFGNGVAGGTVGLSFKF